MESRRLEVTCIYQRYEETSVPKKLHVVALLVRYQR